MHGRKGGDGLSLTSDWK